MRDRKISTVVASAVIAAVLLLSLLGVALAADPTADPSRTIDPKVVVPSQQVTITVVFKNLLAQPKAFALKEVIPYGWGFTRGVDDASAFKPGPPPEWVWFVVGAGETKMVTYDLTVPTNAQPGDYVIGGTVTGATVENPVGGDSTITVTVLYNLTISSTAGGSVTKPGQGVFTYQKGTVVDLVASPNSGYQFVNWTGDVGTIGNQSAASTNIIMNGDYSITANFAAIPSGGQYSLTISSIAGGSVTTPGQGTFTYNAGTVVNLVATPNTGYRFVNWTGNVATVANVTAASTTITMSGNYSITANFALIPPVQYTLTISSTAGGSVTTPGQGTFTYNAGTVVNLVATPNTGYRFVNWTGNVATVANVTAASTTITVNGNYSITANFQEIPPVPSGQYSLTISSTAGGSVTTPSQGTFTYNAGTVVNLVATPNTGYRFVNWTGNVGTVANVTSASTTTTMNGNYSITANFEVAPSPVLPTVTTKAASGITTNSATLNMDYTVGDFSPVQVRFAYKKSPDAVWASTDWTSKTASGTYATLIAELTPGTQYHFKAQLQYSDTVIEGTTLQFATAIRRGCFIATAAYGTPMAEEIQILRDFRDRYLLTNPLGQAFVDFYYWGSPPIAEFITEHPSLKPIVRAVLVPAVAMSTVAVNTTPAQKMAILGLLVLVSAAVGIWATRRHRSPLYA